MERASESIFLTSRVGAVDATDSHGKQAGNVSCFACYMRGIDGGGLELYIHRSLKTLQT